MLTALHVCGVCPHVCGVCQLCDAFRVWREASQQRSVTKHATKRCHSAVCAVIPCAAQRQWQWQCCVVWQSVVSPPSQPLVPLSCRGAVLRVLVCALVPRQFGLQRACSASVSGSSAVRSRQRVAAGSAASHCMA